MNGKQLSELGFTGLQIGLALKAVAERQEAGISEENILKELLELKENPETYKEAVYEKLAFCLNENRKKEEISFKLNPSGIRYPVWGEELIDQGAKAQMNVAMRLPVSRLGALMPDAHVGYGLPIGGVLATENAVIPYGVGVDIGCSMMLSVFPCSFDTFSVEEYKKLLIEHTRFGAGEGFEKSQREDHEVLHESLWQQKGLLRGLHERAVAQIGSSGSGNHFAEFGVMTFEKEEEGVAAGQYLALLTHSGSRGFGAKVAGHFTALAQKMCLLPPEAAKLAWLSLDTEEGEAYWQAMALAGRYALANHELIHGRLARALAETPLLQARNSHNLAWREQLDGREYIVHRKGATPAAVGQLGLIPGSMADTGYLVRGKGNEAALLSASHGAGRQLGRRAAERSIPETNMKAYLAQRGVTLIGGGIDEAPQAYKPIEAVLAYQTDLVEKVASFQPRVVRMDTGHLDI